MENLNISNKIIEKLKRLELKSSRFVRSQMSQKCQKIVNKAKLKQRSDIQLPDWEKLGYANDNWCTEMLRTITYQGIDIEEYDRLTEEDFIEKYEKKNKPVIIKGVTDNWPANTKWTFEVIYYIMTEYL